MTRAKIEDTLLSMGIPAGVKGFAYILGAMEIFEERGVTVNFTSVLYPAIAEKRSVTSSSVERAIRHSFDMARSPKGNRDVVDKYIGFLYTANSHSLKQLYMMLKREEAD